MQEKRLNQLLAATEAGGVKIKEIYQNIIGFLKRSQSAFSGELKTYEPVPGYTDIPGNRSNQQVVTTAPEKLAYFKEFVLPHLRNQLDMEATNADGCEAELIIGDISLGFASTLELLRLKNFFGSPNLKTLIMNVPVRADDKQWIKSTEEQYADREIFQSVTMEYGEFTTEKEEVVLVDPNVTAAIAAGKEINYSPQTTMKTRKVNVGSGTYTTFTGAISHRERAAMLESLEMVNAGIVDALQRANQNVVVRSKINAGDILSMILG